MAAQYLPKDLVQPSSGLKELAQTTKKKQPNINLDEDFGLDLTDNFFYH